MFWNSLQNGNASLAVHEWQRTPEPEVKKPRSAHSAYSAVSDIGMLELDASLKFGGLNFEVSPPP